MNNHTIQPELKVKNPAKRPELIMIVDKRATMMHAAAGVTMQAALREKPSLIQADRTVVPEAIARTMVQIAPVEYPVQPSAPVSTYDSQAHEADARQLVASAHTYNGTPSAYYLQDHQRITPGSQVDSDQLADKFNQLGYEDLGNVAA